MIAQFIAAPNSLRQIISNWSIACTDHCCTHSVLQYSRLFLACNANHDVQLNIHNWLVQLTCTSAPHSFVAYKLLTFQLTFSSSKVSGLLLITASPSTAAANDMAVDSCASFSTGSTVVLDRPALSLELCFTACVLTQTVSCERFSLLAFRIG